VVFKRVTAKHASEIKLLFYVDDLYEWFSQQMLIKYLEMILKYSLKRYFRQLQTSELTESLKPFCNQLSRKGQTFKFMTA